MARKFDVDTVAAAEISGSKITSSSIPVAAFAGGLPGQSLLSTSVRITGITITHANYQPSGAANISAAGGYLVVAGSGFNASSTVIIGNAVASAVSYISATELRAQTPVLVAAQRYPLYVVNPDGAVAIRPVALTTE